MSKVDDELTRRFQRAERPVDGDGVFEGLGARRSHRERLRRVQAGVLALTVLAATAGGFVALRELFDAGDRDISQAHPLPANGEIVFSREGADGRLHLYASQPDGTDVRQITVEPTDDSDPAVSPDGETIAYVRASDDERAIAIVPFEGGRSTKLSDGIFVDDPAWAPDGTEIAFVTSGVDSMLLHIVDREGQLSRSLLDVGGSITSPSWSPDGTRIAIGITPIGSPASVTMIPANTKMESPLEGSLGSGSAPAWSPDGSSVAFVRPGDVGDEIVAIAPDGSSESMIASWVEGSLQPDLAWAPDGTALLVSDGEWIYRVDASPDGDPRDNFERLVEGQSPAWQPVPVEPEPSVTTSPEPEGSDAGLGFPMCNLERLDGIDWYGDGTQGAAWTGARVTDGGSCPASGAGEYIVAADLDGDGMAEPGGMGFLEHCLLCQPVAATDLNGDGVLELVVLEEASSTPSYSLYEVSLPTSERSPGIYSLFVAPPGYPAGGFPGGEPIRFTAGGDEGYSAAIDCEGHPDAPILVVAWSNYQVEVDDTEDVYVTRLRLGDDGAFHVITGEHSTQAVDDPLPIDPAPTACGVAFDPFA
jgi:hypothetical protein